MASLAAFVLPAASKRSRVHFESLFMGQMSLFQGLACAGEGKARSTRVAH